MDTNNQTTNETSVHANGAHTRHIHHHHHHSGGAEHQRHKLLSTQKSKKVFGNVLFVILSLVAIAIMAFVYWIYTNE